MSECDATGGAGYVNVRTGETFCRCVICARCGHHTGNSHQGHYWSWCKVTRTVREFHFCCPGDCELEAKDADAPAGEAGPGGAGAPGQAG